MPTLPKLLIILSAAILLILPSTVFAQELGIGVATYLPLSESAEDGDIVSINDNVFAKSKLQYDPGVVGVVVENPAVEIDTQPIENSYPVISSGDVYVKVITLNGDIKKGDILTTSGEPGIAMKSSRPGFALGIAGEDFSSKNKTEVRKIKVAVHLHYSYSGASDDTNKFERSVSDIFNLSRIATYESPSKVLKYSVASIILLLSVVFGFFTFGRIASRGIEAAGRNPLAGKIIGMSVFLNVLITITIILVGLALAYVIIVL